MHTYMDHLRLREEEREGNEAGESEEGNEREGEGPEDLPGESESTADRLVCLAADDSSAGDSASAVYTAASTPFCHYLCSCTWLRILCAMFLEQGGQGP